MEYALCESLKKITIAESNMETGDAAGEARLYNQLLNQQTEYEKKIKLLEEENERLSRENSQLRKRSDDITSKMASVLETKGELENVGDDFSNTKLAKKFHDLYDSKWPSLIESFQNAVMMDERSAISHLAKLMKSQYEKTVATADQQIRQFLRLQDDGKIPSESEEPTLYKTRKRFGQAKDFVAKILEEEFPPSNDEACQKPDRVKLDDFLKKYTECCWLMTISYPPLAPNFDVIGKQHSGYLLTCYRKFTSQDPVVDVRAVGTIVEVAWPAVTTKDGKSVYQKGDVITVDELKTK